MSSGPGSESGRCSVSAGVQLLADDVVAQSHALVADIHLWPGNQLADLVLALPQKNEHRNGAFVSFPFSMLVPCLCRVKMVSQNSYCSVIPSGWSAPGRRCPYFCASSLLMKWSRSVSCRILSTFWPVCRASTWLSLLPGPSRISLAWMSTSVACPSKPPMRLMDHDARMRQRSSACPCAPAASNSAPMLAACPMHRVLTSELDRTAWCRAWQARR